MSDLKIAIRDMRDGEEPLLWQLFHTTIHTVNAADYSPAQIQAWSPADRDPIAWRARMQSVKPFVAVIDDEIVGFSDVQDDGLVDFMFVAHDRQGRGIAAALMQEVERRARLLGLESLYAHVSATAKPFFSRRGFAVENEQRVVINDVELTNYLMRREQI